MPRKHYIDIAKGIGILLVVIGHLPTGSFLHNYIYSFHMPFFFFISGYLTKEVSNKKAFVIKKVQRLIVPYFFFGIASILYMLAIKVLTNNAIEQKHIDDILRIFYYNGNPLPINKVIWFLMVLFWVEVLHLTLNKKNKTIVFAISYFFWGGVIISLLSNKYQFRLPFGLDILPIAYAFFVMGNIVKHSFNVDVFNKKHFIIGFIVMFTLSILANYVLHNPVDMMKLQYGNPLYFILQATIGIFMLFSLSLWLNRFSIIEYLGINSIIILGFHVLIKNMLNQLELFFTYSLPPWGFFAILILLHIPVIYIVNKYLYYFIGLRKTK